MSSSWSVGSTAWFAKIFFSGRSVSVRPAGVLRISFASSLAVLFKDTLTVLRQGQRSQYRKGIFVFDQIASGPANIADNINDPRTHNHDAIARLDRWLRRVLHSIAQVHGDGLRQRTLMRQESGLRGRRSRTAGDRDEVEHVAFSANGINSRDLDFAHDGDPLGRVLKHENLDVRIA